MDDTSDITALDMVPMTMVENRSAFRSRFSRALHWCKDAVTDHKRSKLRKELVKDVFDADE